MKIALVAIVIALAVSYFTFGRNMLRKASVDRISIENTKPAAVSAGPLNTDNADPITGVACDNWKGRPVAVMQPADVTARPAAGFSQADIMFEMPAFTNANTRLMGVYLCDIPDDIGSIRSARHDYIPFASGLGAIFVHWGYSHFAQTLLMDRKVIDNIDCLTTSYCGRWPKSGKMQLEDTGHITKANIESAMQKYGYKTTGTFVGYPHQADLAIDQRPTGGHLRLAYPSVYDVDYDYDRTTNSYLRTWDGVADTDKNNGKRVAPKNIVVMTATSEQITLAKESQYIADGVMDPWSLIPEADRAGINGIPGAPNIGRYNNLQVGDPWFDTVDSGDAYFYMNGQQVKGTWKKDRSKIDSKLTFRDQSGQEIQFVPGQIWVEIMEPGQGMKWTSGM